MKEAAGKMKNTAVPFWVFNLRNQDVCWNMRLAVKVRDGLKSFVQEQNEPYTRLLRREVWLWAAAKL